MGVEDDYVAFCLDQAAAYWGRSIEIELDGVEDPDPRMAEWKRRAILDRFFEGEEAPVRPGKFADPMQFLNK
jgi:hypothetical protein